MNSREREFLGALEVGAQTAVERRAQIELLLVVHQKACCPERKPAIGQESAVATTDVGPPGVICDVQEILEGVEPGVPDPVLFRVADVAPKRELLIVVRFREGIAEIDTHADPPEKIGLHGLDRDQLDGRHAHFTRGPRR